MDFTSSLIIPRAFVENRISLVMGNGILLAFVPQ